jgi:hypothetical protein
MYELANCYRNGWGIKKDPVAAKQYYETAANLGDTDAMNEVAWCYVEGFGTKKDKVSMDASFLSFIDRGALVVESVVCMRRCLTGSYSHIVLIGRNPRTVNFGRSHHAPSLLLLRHHRPLLSPSFSLICWAAICRSAADNLRLTVQGGSVPTPRRVKGK